MKQYKLCDFEGLVDLVVNRVIEYSQEDDKERVFGTIDFKVEDLPTSHQLAPAECASAYESATGAYGITTIYAFDQDGIQLIFGYYGGCEGIVSVYFDDNYEIEPNDARIQIRNALQRLLAYEMPVNRFLVEIADGKENHDGTKRNS